MCVRGEAWYPLRTSLLNDSTYVVHFLPVLPVILRLCARLPWFLRPRLKIIQNTISGIQSVKKCRLDERKIAIFVSLFAFLCALSYTLHSQLT